MKKDKLISNEDHLIKIKEIILSMIKPYNFNYHYFELKGSVTFDIYSRLEISCSSELDKYTLKEVKQIQEDFYNKIRIYLEENEIENTLYIETEDSNIVIYFKDIIGAFSI